MRNLILVGVLRRIFKIRVCFVPRKSILDLFGPKWPARMVTVKLHLFIFMKYLLFGNRTQLNSITSVKKLTMKLLNVHVSTQLKTGSNRFSIGPTQKPCPKMTLKTWTCCSKFFPSVTTIIRANVNGKKSFSRSILISFNQFISLKMKNTSIGSSRELFKIAAWGLLLN